MKNNDFLPYEYDASNIKGSTKGVYFPTTIEEVRKIVLKEPRICIRGGGSGLAGGAVPEHNQDIVLDLSKLTKIGQIDFDRQTIEVEAGVILDDLQTHLKEHSLEFPVNPSSHGICTMGGMIATNAVGSRAIKYGKTSKWVRWIDVMDSNGNIDRKGKTEMSDYSGMEGITGVIIKACLNLSQIKKRTATLIKITNRNKIIETLKQLRKDENVSIIEFIDKKISTGIGLTDNYHLVVEYESAFSPKSSSENSSDSKETRETSKGLLDDSEYEKLMEKRDSIYPFLAAEGYTRIEDPKIIIDKFPILLKWLEAKKIPVFGHLSVGILHPCFYIKQEKYIPEMMKLVKRLGGKVSGEHGIGLLKKQFVDPQDRRILENIKKRTDPKGKFNIGKII
jgi:glycolate oxidase